MLEIYFSTLDCKLVHYYTVELNKAMHHDVLEEFLLGWIQKVQQVRKSDFVSLLIKTFFTQKIKHIFNQYFNKQSIFFSFQIIKGRLDIVLIVKHSSVKKDTYNWI